MNHLKIIFLCLSLGSVAGAQGFRAVGPFATSDQAILNQEALQDGASFYVHHGSATTMEAGAFIGDGSGLTNISTAAIPDVWVNVSGDTMTGQLTIDGSSLTVGGIISATRYDISGSTVLVLSGNKSLSVGQEAGSVNTGEYNTFLGALAGNSNTSANANTFIGFRAGKLNTTGIGNTFTGRSCGEYNTTGEYNTFAGRSAGGYATGTYNTFTGAFSGEYSSGIYNTFTGIWAGYDNTGNNNTFTGVAAGGYNTSGSNNTFTGFEVGFSNTTGSSSTIVGYRAGKDLTTGNDNILLGFQAGDNLTTGGNNIIIGYDLDAPSVSTNNYLSIGDLIYGDIDDGRVGISTSAPAAELAVVGDGLFTGEVRASTFNAIGSAYQMNGNTIIHNDGTIHAFTENAIAMTVGTGTVGINYQILFDGEENDGTITWDHDFGANGKFLMGCALEVSSISATDLLCTDEIIEHTPGAGIQIGSAKFSVGGSTFVIKNGQIGIRTANPANPLHITGKGFATTGWDNDTGSIESSGVNYQLRAAGSTRGLILATKSLPRLMIEAEGNVGIGTTNPTRTLEVVGTARLAQMEFASSDFSSGGYGKGIWAAGGSGIGDLGLNNYNGSIIFQTSNGGAPTARMYIDNVGNVGIGTTNPDAQLHVTKSGGFAVIKSSGTSGGCLMIRDTDNAGWTKCKVLDGVMTCATDADGVCD